MPQSSRSVPLALSFVLLGAFPAAAQQTEDAEPRLARFDVVQPGSGYHRQGTQHASCRGRVVDGDGAPVQGCRVLLLDYVPFYWALPVAEARSDDSGAFVLEVEQCGGNVVIWVLSPRDRPFATRWKDISMVSGREIDAGDVQLALPSQAAAGPVTLRGRVLDSAGEPVAGALVRSPGEEDRFDPGAVTTTAADGSFSFVQRAGARDHLQLFLPNHRVTVEHAAGVEELTYGSSDWKLDLTQDELVLQHASFRTYDLRTPEDGPEVVFFSGRDLQWQQLPEDRVTVRRGDHGGSTTVCARVAGHLPWLVRVRGDVDVTVPDEGKFELRVIAGSAPLAGARVDVCDEDDDFLMERTMATFVTGGDGRLRLRGAEDRRAVVYVYADGHAPVRARWRAGQPLEVRLPALSGQLRCTMPEGTVSLFVRLAGSFAHAATAYPGPGAEVELPLAPGSYEVTVYGEAGVAAMERVDVTGNAVVEPALDVDERPAVTLKLPAVPDAAAGDEWWVFGGRRMLGGMISKWRAYSGGGRARRTRALDAEVEPVPGAAPTFALRFPVTGRFTIQCGHDKLAHRYFAPVVLAAGDSAELELPLPDAELSGSMPEFPESWGFGAQHGIAGPRLVLRPDRAAGTTWGALVALAEPEDFTLERMPSGALLLGHHLYETGFIEAGDGHHGEVPVGLARGEQIDVGELAKDGVDMRVALRDAAGAPLTGRLYVRDRMFDSWSAVVSEGTTLRNAMDPIPTPPSAELVAGAAVLERLRPGRVEFVLCQPDGGRIWFEREVSAGVENRWIVGGAEQK